MTTLESLDLENLWSNQTPDEADDERRARFLRNVGRRCNLTLTQMRGLVNWCCDCADPHLVVNLAPATASEWVCTNCRDRNWSRCWECRLWERADEAHFDTNNNAYCDRCADVHLWFCEQCDCYWRRDSGHAHEPVSECCTSPQPLFLFPSGDDFLANDERVVVTIPDGEINDSGREAINYRLRVWSSMTPVDEMTSTGFNVRQMAYDLAYAIDGNVGWEWKGEGGNFTTRLKRYAYNTWKLRIPTEVLTDVGSLAGDHRSGGEFTLALTRDLNLPAGEFWHGGSCWWSDYAYSRCTLKSNGGFGMRTFDGPAVTGRAWVIPLKRAGRHRRLGHGHSLTPTFNTRDPYAFVVFNGYGNLDGHTAPALLATLTGWKYQRVNLAVARMYVNNESGYLLAPEGRPVPSGFELRDTTDHADLWSAEQNTEGTVPVGETEREQGYVAAF